MLVQVHIILGYCVTCNSSTSYVCATSYCFLWTLSPRNSRIVGPNRILSVCSQLNSRVRFFGGLGGGSDLHRDFHSTPDLNVQVQSSILAPKGHRSQEDVNALNGRNGLPPPNHPPPPPPVGQVVKVNVGANVPDVVTPASVYDNMAHIQQVKGTVYRQDISTRYGSVTCYFVINFTVAACQPPLLLCW